MRNLKSALLFLFLAANLASAQVAVGIRAGVVLANQSIEITGLDVNPEIIAGPWAAVVLEIPLADKFSIMPELGFIRKGSRIPDDAFGPGSGSTVSFNQIEAVVSGKYTLPLRNSTSLYLAAGPYWSYALSGRMKNEFETRDIDFDTDPFKRFELGLGAGLGMEFKAGPFRLFPELRYQHGLSNIRDNEDSVIEVTTKNRCWGMALGLLLPI